MLKHTLQARFNTLYKVKVQKSEIVFSVKLTVCEPKPVKSGAPMPNVKKDMSTEKNGLSTLSLRHCKI